MQTKVKDVIAYLQTLDPEMLALIELDYLRCASPIMLDRDFKVADMGEYGKNMFREWELVKDYDSRKSQEPVKALVINA